MKSFIRAIVMFVGGIAFVLSAVWLSNVVVPTIKEVEVIKEVELVKPFFVSDRVQRCIDQGGEYILFVGDTEWDKCKVEKEIEL